MRKTKTLLLGATMFSLGFAFSHKIEDSLILEKGANLLCDFVQPINVKKVDLNANYCNKTLEIKNELVDRFIMNDNGIYHNFLVSFAMGQRCFANKTKILFMTEVLSIKKTDGGYITEIYCADGFTSIFSENVIDNTSMGIFCHPDDSEYSKSICCMVSRESENYSLPENALAINGLWNEIILKYRLSNSTDFITAKRIGDDTVRHISGCKYLSCSAYFAYDFKHLIKKQLPDGTFFIPSASYENILTAFDGGATWSF